MIGKTFLFVWWKGDKEWEALINAVTKKEENLFLIIGSPLLIYARGLCYRSIRDLLIVTSGQPMMWIAVRGIQTYL